LAQEGRTYVLPKAREGFAIKTRAMRRGEIEAGVGRRCETALGVWRFARGAADVKLRRRRDSVRSMAAGSRLRLDCSRGGTPSSATPLDRTNSGFRPDCREAGSVAQQFVEEDRQTVEDIHAAGGGTRRHQGTSKRLRKSGPVLYHQLVGRIAGARLIASWLLACTSHWRGGACMRWRRGDAGRCWRSLAPMQMIGCCICDY